MMGSRNNFCARLLSGAAMMSLVAFSGIAHAETADFSIPPQPLDQALKAFGAQSGHSMMIDMDLVRAKTSPGVTASADPETALKRLLTGTGLSYKRNGDIFAIVAVQIDAPVRRAPEPVSQAETVSGSAVEGLVVTAQKKRESIQDVPIAISAFSEEALQAQKIEGGFDLLKAIPNVTFSKNNFTGFNFSIRGIGTKAVSATTDPGVAVAFNNTGLIQNRLFEQEYFDVERVEVLRGPQGTLYGRNATAGVINVISGKPDMNDFEGSLKGEIGNYDTKRLVGVVNIPLVEDKVALRLAGSMTDRKGFDYNDVTKHAVNGRDLWSGRMTLAFNPTERLRTSLMWERFEEDDNRSRTGKQLCHRDPGRQSIGGVSARVGNDYEEQLFPALFSQGCLPGSLYDDAAYGTPNGLALPLVFGMLQIGAPCASPGFGCYQLFSLGFANEPYLAGDNLVLESQNLRTLLQLKDPYGGAMQSRDLRRISSFKDPVYRANADIVGLDIDFDITDALTLTSQSVYNKDSTYSFQDFNRFNTVPVFNDTSGLYNPDVGPEPSPWANLAPGGVFCDPQLGCSNTIAGFDISKADSEQISQEIRLQSNFDGPLNFSLGANYTSFEVEADYYVFYNLLTAFAWMPPFYEASGGEQPWNPDVCYMTGSFMSADPPLPAGDPLASCVYVDPNPIESINGEGHNYFRSRNPYSLESKAAFGELYWQASDTLKVTAGLRFTDDRKRFVIVPSQVLLSEWFINLGAVSRGYPEEPPIKQHWGEWSGRLGIDWKPELSFTDDTLLYAFYSRGYKGGGANPPGIGYSGDYWDLVKGSFAVSYGKTFEPEFVDAFEIGSKNTLLGGALTLNSSAFYYDYRDYQVSKIIDRLAVNENFDATLWGLEFESVLAPTKDVRLNASLGYLDTSIADGERSLDLMNRTQGNPNYIVMKPWPQFPSNCIVPIQVVEYWAQQNKINSNTSGIHLVQTFGDLCNAGINSGVPFDPAFNGPFDYANYPEINNGNGILADLSGNELPNSPHWTVSLGGEYSRDFAGGWQATLRGDAYWQSQSYARVYNAVNDKLHGWYNLNLSLWLENEDGLKIELYAKNLLDKTPITDAFINSDDTALTTNVFVLDPRLVGLSIKKEF